MYGERRFGALLVVLAALLAGPPVLLGFGLSAAWFDGLMALLMVAAILSLCFERRQRLFALLLGIPAVLLSFGGHALPGQASAAVLLAGHLCEVLFLFGASALIVRWLFSAPALTFDSTLGAVCGYLLLGLAFGSLYALIESVWPNSFWARQEITSQLASVHRVLSGLAKQGLIVRLGRRFSSGRTHWCTPEWAAKHPGGWSDRAVAERIGVSASTVRRARAKLEKDRS